MEADGTIAANLNFLGFTEASIVQTLKNVEIPPSPQMWKNSAHLPVKNTLPVFSFMLEHRSLRGPVHCLGAFNIVAI